MIYQTLTCTATSGRLLHWYINRLRTLRTLWWMCTSLLLFKYY